MASASGIGYDEASQDQIIRMVDGVPIPFASPRLLYRMKEKTHREKSAPTSSSFARTTPRRFLATVIKDRFCRKSKARKIAP